MPGGSGSRGKAPGAPFPQRPPLDVVFLTGALDAQGGSSLKRLSLGHEEAVLCVRHYRPHSAGSRGGHARNIRTFAQLCSNLLDGAIHSQIGFSPPSVTFPGIFRRCLKTKGTMLCPLHRFLSASQPVLPKSEEKIGYQLMWLFVYFFTEGGKKAQKRLLKKNDR